LVFSVDERERVRDRLVAKARSDPRVVSSALVGADARGEVDRWSDIDLTMGVGEGASVEKVVDEWTRDLVDELGAVHLFDLPVGSTLYRVFLFEGNLQVDVSFTPEADFTAEKPPAPPPSARHVFGLGVHHAVRARFCVERGRLWQAEYWISGVRDEALTLVCLREGLPAAYGRGFDRLPAAVLGQAEQALVRAPEREELLRALQAAVELLLRHGGNLPAAGVAGQLRELADPRTVYS
jgi:predicted nucleotidyltransferase